MSAVDSHFSILVIGTGLAGYTLARDIRKLDTDCSLCLVTRDDGSYYSKPMLSNGFAKKKSAEDLAQMSAETMATSLDATIMTETNVVKINPIERTIDTGGGIVGYDKLVLACGAQQIRLPLKGDGASSVLSVNDLDDYARFRSRLENASRVAVMGPGLIGCEFANDLSTAGIKTILIGPDTRPLERLVPEAVSSALTAAFDELGVQWHLETVVTQIDKTPSGFRLQLSSGESVDADLVLSAVGLKPDLALATTAGLETATGIIVDQTLCTTDKNIFALGDCIELNNQIMPYILPIMHASKALARTLTGTSTDVVLPAMPVAIKTPIHPIIVASPNAGVVGEWVVESDQDGVKALFMDQQNNLAGFVLSGKSVRQKGKLERELPMVLEAGGS